MVRRVAGAVAAVIPVERMYSLSLGSQQGNAHLHWHVAQLAGFQDEEDKAKEACSRWLVREEVREQLAGGV